MRHSSFAAFLLVLSLSSLAAADPAVELHDDEAVTRWVNERGRRAREGHADLVRLPIAHQSAGWG